MRFVGQDEGQYSNYVSDIGERVEDQEKMAKFITTMGNQLLIACS